MVQAPLTKKPSNAVAAGEFLLEGFAAMTANAFAEDVQASMDAGMTAHVAKPIDVQVLWSTLDRVLREGKNGLV